MVPDRNADSELTRRPRGPDQVPQNAHLLRAGDLQAICRQAAT